MLFLTQLLEYVIFSWRPDCRVCLGSLRIYSCKSIFAFLNRMTLHLGVGKMRKDRLLYFKKRERIDCCLRLWVLWWETIHGSLGIICFSICFVKIDQHFFCLFELRRTSSIRYFCLVLFQKNIFLPRLHRDWLVDPYWVLFPRFFSFCSSLPFSRRTSGPPL